MKRMVYLVACLPFWLTSCEEKVTALHFNEAEQVYGWSLKRAPKEYLMSVCLKKWVVKKKLWSRI